MHVFISYSRDDGSEIAESLHDDLENTGYDAWLDKRDIRDGMNWNTEIDKGLRLARAVAVVVTPGSNLSLQVESEWNEALNNYMPVIPLIAGGEIVPRVLKMLNWIDFRDDTLSGFSSLVNRLECLEEDHLEYLNKLLEGYLEAQRTSENPKSFEIKIAGVKQAIERTTNSDAWQEQLREQEQQAEESLEEERKRIQSEAEKRHEAQAQKVVGERLLDISGHFRNRETQRAELARLLTNANTRVVSIIGNGGIGKTAIVSKILADLEDGVWTYTDEPPAFDGIAYLSKNTQGSISLERIFQVCAEMLGGEKGRTLLGVWNAEIDVEDKIRQILNMLREGFYIILLDNMEDFLNEDREIADEDLRCFFEMSIQTSNNARLLVTSRIPLTFPQELMRFDNQILIKEGLPDDDAIKLLRDLDPSGIYGLKDADEELLRTTSHKVVGVPRALEVIASIIRNDPLTTLEDLIQQDEIFEHEEFLEQLVRQNYKRMNQDGRKILEALAVFQQSVPIAAIDFMLQDFAPDIQTRTVISGLIQVHMVNFDRKNKLLTLHPVDREFIYRALPDDTRRLMHLRAALYYDEIGLEEQQWKSLADVETHLARFNHLVLGGEHVLALELINRLDEDYLYEWGDSRRVLEARLHLIDNLVVLENEAQNRQRIVELYNRVGDPNQGLALLEAFVPIVKASEKNDLIADTLFYFGKILINITGDFRERLEYYEQALRYAEKTQNMELRTKILRVMSVTYRYLRDFDKSIEHAKLAIRLTEDNKNLQIKGLVVLGRTYRVKHNYDLALEVHEQALKLAREIDDPKEIGLRLENVGFDYYSSHQYEKALEIFDEGFKLSQATPKNPQLQIKFLRALAFVTLRLNQVSKSLEFRQQRIQVAKKENKLNKLMQSYQLLADFYSVTGDYRAAIDTLRQSIEIAEQLNYQRDLIKFQKKIGQYLSLIGEYTDAQRIFDRSLSLARDQHLDRLCASIQIEKGKSYIMQREYQFAEREIQSALGIALQTNRTNQIAYRSQYLAEIKLAQEKWVEAKTLLEIARETNIEKILYSNAALLGITYLGLGEMEKAEEMFYLSVNLSEFRAEKRHNSFRSVYTIGLSNAGLAVILETKAEVNLRLETAIHSYNLAKTMCGAIGLLDQQRHRLNLFKPFDADNRLEPIWKILG